jgi:hypothetical protein
MRQATRRQVNIYTLCIYDICRLKQSTVKKSKCPSSCFLHTIPASLPSKMKGKTGQQPVDSKRRITGKPRRCSEGNPRRHRLVMASPLSCSTAGVWFLQGLKLAGRPSTRRRYHGSTYSQSKAAMGMGMGDRSSNQSLDRTILCAVGLIRTGWMGRWLEKSQKYKGRKRSQRLERRFRSWSVYLFCCVGCRKGNCSSLVLSPA